MTGFLANLSWWQFILIFVVCVVGIIILVLFLIKRVYFKKTKDGVVIRGIADTATNLLAKNIEGIFDLIIESVEEIVEIATNRRIESQMIYTENKLRLVHHKFCELFLVMLREKGIQKQNLTGHRDFKFFCIVAREMLFGFNSTRDYLRGLVKSNGFLNKEGREYDTYVKDAFEGIWQSWVAYLNTEYENTLVGYDEKIVYRVVSREELYDTLEKEVVHEAKDVIKSIFSYAREIIALNESKRTESLDKLKSKLMGLFRTNGV